MAFSAVGDFLLSGWMLLIVFVIFLLIGGYVFLAIRYNRRRNRQSRS